MNKTLTPIQGGFTLSTASGEPQIGQGQAPGGSPQPSSGPTPAGGQADEFAAITSQDQLDQVLSGILGKRLARFKDYDDVKAKAARLDELEEAQKTEAQKQADAIALLTKENESLKVEALRAQVAAAKGVPARLLIGATKEDMEAAADELLSFRGAAAPAPQYAKIDAPGEKEPIAGAAQITSAEQIKSMTPTDLMTALKEGKLTEVLKG